MTGVPVLTAVADAAREAALVAAFEREPLGVSVVRRCVDLADLLAVAATGSASVALVSADLRRLDRDAVARLAAAGVTVIGLTDAADPGAEQRLVQLGIQAVAPPAADPGQVAALVREAVQGPGVPPRTGGARGAGGPLDTAAASLPISTESLPPVARGRLVAVWGPVGSPGRTTVSLGIAAELAALAVPVALADLDTYGGTVGQYLGLLEDVPGLAAAARSANLGVLDAAGLAALLRTVPVPGAGTLRVLTGVLRAQRWPEVGGPALEIVLETARLLAAVTVLDCGFCLEADEELSFDLAAPRRNAAALTALAAADLVVVVGAADPVGMARLVRGLADLRELLPQAELQVVLNKVRPTALRGDPGREAAGSLGRHCGLPPAALLPYDLAAVDAAMAGGRTLLEAAARSPLQRALSGYARQLAEQLALLPADSPRPGRLRRRIGAAR